MNWDWFPVVFFPLKILVLSVGMYFAIKWHYEQAGNVDRAAVLRTGGKMVAVFLLVLAAVGLLTFVLVKAVGLDLSFS